MTLELDQIKTYILDSFNKELISKAREHHRKVNMHVNGVGLDAWLKQIKTYENDQQYLLRKQYKRSNKALYSNLLRPLDKVFHTRGGAKYYNLSENQEKEFKQILSSLPNGFSVEKFCETIWKQKKITDPSGIIFIEISVDGESSYPSYKSITSILDYQFNNTSIEYVIFEPEEVLVGDKTFEKIRVVDDAFDYMFRKEEDEITLIEDETFPNYWGYVPAIIISNEFDEVYGYAKSFIDSSIELADEVVCDNSVKNIFKKTSGFPSYWEYERKCLVCSNSPGYLNGDKCPSCGGDGIRKSKDVSDITVVALNEQGESNPTPPSGYVAPDITTWKQMNEEEDYLKQAIHYAQWGTLAFIEDSVQKTATGVTADLMPVHDQLNVFSSEAESIEKFITDTIGRFYYGLGYKGSTIIYGRRYVVESPDQIINKLAEMKQKGVSENIQRNKYKEYLQAEYNNDPYEMTKQIKIFDLDLFPLYTTKDFSDMGLEKAMIEKLLFGEWIKTIPDNELIFEDKKKLQNDRDIFINEKINKYGTEHQENVQGYSSN